MNANADKDARISAIDPRYSLKSYPLRLDLVVDDANPDYLFLVSKGAPGRIVHTVEIFDSALVYIIRR